MNLSSISSIRARLRPTQLTAAFIIFGLIAAYILSSYIINEDLIGLEFIGVALAVLVLVVAILSNWRTGLLIFLVWLPFEDLVRKYLGNNMAIYFAKDVLVVVFYFSFVVAARRQQIKVFRPPFQLPLLLMVWFAAMQVFNPASPSIFFGLMGLKLFFLYVPLTQVGYWLFRSEEDLWRFFSINLIIVLVIASLGIAQSIIGPTFLNPAVIQEDIRGLSTLYRISPISGLVSYRPTSVFVSTGRFANFLGIEWLLILGYTGCLLLRQRKAQILAFVAAAVAVAAIVMSTSRGAFIWAIIHVLVFSMAFLWGSPWRRNEVRRVLRAIRRTSLGIVAAFVLLVFLFPQALQSRLSIYYETLSPESPQSELIHRGYNYPIQEFLKAFSYDRWPYGYGIGTSGLGTQYVTRLLHVRSISAGVESGFGAIVIQMGIVGLLLWFAMSGAIILSAWRVVGELKGSIWFPLAFVIFWFALKLLILDTYGGIAAYEDFVLNAYLWLLLGILFRLPDLARSAALVTIGKQENESKVDSKYVPESRPLRI